MSKVLIHIGAHKSASTTIQRGLRKYEKALRDKAGIDFRGTRLFFQDEFYRVLFRASDGQSISNTKRMAQAQSDFNRYVEEADGKNLFLSSEGFLGNSNLIEQGGIYPHADAMLEALREITKDADVDILLLTRRQDTFIESCWMQQLKEGRHPNFEAFVDAAASDKMHWLDIADSISRHFGRDHTHIEPFEQIINEGTIPFLTRLVKILPNGQNLGFELDVPTKANASMAAIGVEVAQAVYPILDAHKVDNAVRKQFRSLIFNSLSSANFPKKKYMNPERAQEILRDCAESNTKMVEKYCPHFDIHRYLPKS